MTTTTIPTKTERKAPPPARLTIIGQIYHQIEGDQPTVIEVQYGRHLKSDEQPYGPRRLKLTADRWIPLDLGWLEGKAVGLLVIEHEGKPPHADNQTQPTVEAKRVDDSRIVTLALVLPKKDKSRHSMLDPKEPDPLPTPVLFLGRGEVQQIRPCPLTKWVLSCSEGEARVKVTAYPD